jgi:hypothetical protein
MSFQICELAVYGPVEEPRTILFRPGQVNIITGGSKSGKSALISIIDYCLGRKSCHVPDGPIRNTIEWYGLRLTNNDQEMLVIRKGPESGRDTSAAVHIEHGATLEFPPKSSIRQTTTVEAAVGRLSRFAGISDNIHESPAGHTRDPLTATIRHALFFCFQPQDELISRKHLFYRESEEFLAQTIKDVLPYFLGAIDEEYIQKKERLRRLKRGYKQHLRELREYQAIRGEGESKARALLAEAQDLGLVSFTEEPTKWEETVDFLRTAQRAGVPTAPDYHSELSGDEYDQILADRQELSNALRRIQIDLDSAIALKRESREYATEGGEQQGRLKSIGLFQSSDDDHVTCPLCASTVLLAATAAMLEQVASDLTSRLE